MIEFLQIQSYFVVYLIKRRDGKLHLLQESQNYQLAVLKLNGARSVFLLEHVIHVNSRIYPVRIEQKSQLPLHTNTFLPGKTRT